MNGQMSKRRDPFAKPIVAKKEENVIQEEELKVVEPETVENYDEEAYEEVVEEVQQPIIRKVIQKNTPKVVKSNQKNRYVEPDDVQRDKYTSTMETTLRRKIKIICATRGIMFSEFIEEACREKIKREGE